MKTIFAIFLMCFTTFAFPQDNVKGDQDNVGSAGLEGPHGDQGQGPKGDIGSEGPQGLKGDESPDGEQQLE